MKTKLRKDDLVQVIAGKDRSRSGTLRRGRVLRIDRAKGRVIVEGLNMVRKTQKPKRAEEKGQMIDVEAALDVSNVMLVCSKCGPVRSGYRFAEKRKQRYCRKCGEIV